MTTHREVICSDYLTVSINNITGRNLELITRLGNNLFSQTCCFVGLSTEGNTLDNVVELQCTSILCYDNGIEWVPLSNLVALGNLVAIIEVE